MQAVEKLQQSYRPGTFLIFDNMAIGDEGKCGGGGSKEKGRENGVCSDASTKPITENDVRHDDNSSDPENPQLPGWFAEYSPLWPGLSFFSCE